MISVIFLGLDNPVLLLDASRRSPKRSKNTCKYRVTGAIAHINFEGDGPQCLSLSRKRGHVGWMGRREERKERCSPWECPSITLRLRPTLSHCHREATSTPPERSPRTSTALPPTQTHTLVHSHKFSRTHFPSVAPSPVIHCCCHTNTDKHWYAHVYCTCRRENFINHIWTKKKVDSLTHGNVFLWIRSVRK